VTAELFELVGAEADRRFSPYCWRSRMALAHKGIPAAIIPWHFTDKEKLAPSGQGRVPVLVIDGKWIADSTGIADYLEENFPDRPSLFGGPVGRKLSTFYGNWTDTFLQLALFRLTVLDIYAHLWEGDKDYFRRSREERFGQTLEAFGAGRDQRVVGFRQSLAPLRLTLQAQPFLGGDAPLYPDYIVFGAFQWIRCISDFAVLAPDDAIAAWRRRMLDLHDGLAGKAKGYPV
jgi:glutathione S-transferase